MRELQERGDTSTTYDQVLAVGACGVCKTLSRVLIALDCCLTTLGV